jgi:hypothetical protein
MPSLSPAGGPLTLTSTEWGLIWRLRDVAAGGVKEEVMDAVMDAVREVLDLVLEPRCAEAQADGVPCVAAILDCAQCQRVRERLGRVRAALRG